MYGRIFFNKIQTFDFLHRDYVRFHKIETVRPFEQESNIGKARPIQRSQLYQSP